jgi:hypothetical protein
MMAFAYVFDRCWLGFIGSLDLRVAARLLGLSVAFCVDFYHSILYKRFKNQKYSVDFQKQSSASPFRCNDSLGNELN